MLRVHNQQCGGCFKNVCAVSQTTKDPYKAKIYSNLYVSSLMASMKRAGGDHQIAETNDGHSVRMVYPPSMSDRRVAGTEAFIAKDPQGESWVIADVTRQEYFDDPSAILEWLDEGIISHVQECETRPEWRPIQWLNLALQRQTTAFVRWEGRVKKVAVDWHLQGRFQELLRKYAPVDLRQERVSVVSHGKHDAKTKGFWVLK